MNNSVFIDNATIHAAASTFERPKKKMRIRPINILAISSLIDAFIMFDGIVIDNNVYRYFTNKCPSRWFAQLNSVIKTETISLEYDYDELDKFLSSDIGFWLCNILIKTEQEYGLRQAYMSYVGYDFGINNSDSNLLHQIEEILRKRHDWEYNSADTRHIDIIHASWKGLLYSDYCLQNNISYYPHELRGRFIDFIATLFKYKHPVSYIEEIMSKVRENILKDRIRELKENALMQYDDLIVWKALKVPIFAAKVFQESKTNQDLFENARILREKAKPLRLKCFEYEQALKEGSHKKIDSIFNEISTGLNNLSISPDKAINWSISVGFPLKLALAVGGKFSYNRSCLNFVRDIYTARSIPLTLNNDIIRLFGEDMSSWQRALGTIL
jgi:hypothetical protein